MIKSELPQLIEPTSKSRTLYLDKKGGGITKVKIV
jgi:hypothetical protein